MWNGVEWVWKRGWWAPREPKYRIDRAAQEAAAWQGLKNLIRRLLRLPIVVTAEQAWRDERAHWDADDHSDIAGERDEL